MVGLAVVTMTRWKNLAVIIIYFDKKPKRSDATFCKSCHNPWILKYLTDRGLY